MNDDREVVTYDEAVAMLPEGDTIHTFRNPGMNVLVGADWDRSSVLEAFRKFTVERSGEQATAAKHGLAFQDDSGWVFVETVDPARAPIANKARTLETLFMLGSAVDA